MVYCKKRGLQRHARQCFCFHQQKENVEQTLGDDTQLAKAVPLVSGRAEAGSQSSPAPLSSYPFNVEGPQLGTPQIFGAELQVALCPFQLCWVSLSILPQ